MKTVSFKCDESSTQLFIQILNKLAVAGDKNQTRKIRIGGDEYSFIGGCDNVSELSIDGILYSTLTTSEQRDIEILREAIVSPSVPAPSGFQSSNPITSSIAPLVSTFNDSTVAADVDDDLLDSDEATAVRDIVVDKVGQNDMFTAFDITKSLRNNGNQVHHRNVKQIVHALYNNGEMQGYNRSLIDISGANIRPFLYHPISSDPSTYQS